MAREMTNYLLESAENGEISWETIARVCLGYMSEYEVSDMAQSEELFSNEDEDEDEDEDKDEDEDQ